MSFTGDHSNHIAQNMIHSTAKQQNPEEKLTKQIVIDSQLSLFIHSD